MGDFLQTSSKRATGKRSAPYVPITPRALSEVPHVGDGTLTECDTRRDPQTPQDTTLDISDTLDTTGHHRTHPDTPDTPDTPDRTPRTPRTQTHVSVSKTRLDTPDTKLDTTRTARTPYPDTHRTHPTLGPDTHRTHTGHHRTPGHPGHPGLRPAGVWRVALSALGRYLTDLLVPLGLRHLRFTTFLARCSQ